MDSRIVRILLSLGLGCTLVFASPQAATKSKSYDHPTGERSAQPASSNPVDLNRASQKDLEALPGVGAATAKKIVAGRPYASVTELQKAGVSAKTIEKITPLVTTGGSATGTGSATSAANSGSGGRSTSQEQEKPSAGTSAKIDLNTASEKDIQTLPGVGAATAKKIIANRPYSSVDDLSKTGISKSKVDKLSGLVVVGAISNSTPKPGQDSAKSSKESKSGVAQSSPSQVETRSAPASPGSMSRSTSETPQGTAQQPPQPGMVWVNLDTKVYHQPGHRWYGKTKHGQFMTEDEAVKSGFHASKE